MTLLKGAEVVDGTGSAGFVGDILFDADRIVDVVKGDSHASADTIIDASGYLVTPGFIDAHAHSDAYLIIEPTAPSKVSQGITTEINGQCGGSVVPRYGEARLSSDWASILGDRLNWHSLGEYRRELEQVHPSINTVQFIGHNTLRSSVMGYAARAASPDDLAAMGKLLEQMLDEGGWGLSTGLIYQPGRYSTPDEVLYLARIAAKHGGFYATHMRSEGDAIIEAIDEVLDLVRATGIRAEISHLKTSGCRNWSKIDAVLEKMNVAVDRGMLLGSDRYPYCASSTDLDIVLPDWAQEGAAKAECVRLADASLRSRIADEINSSGRDWSTVVIGGTWSDATKPFSGKRVSEILSGNSFAATTPGELICRILAEDECRTGAFFFGMSEENLAKIYSQPWIVPGSDASLRAPWGPLGNDFPHPRAYATMPEFYRRVRALGFSKESTIARMTSMPARRFNLRDRGVLRKGAFADIVVWKESEFKAVSSYADPHRFTAGIKAVFVNGVLTYDGESFIGRAGRFLEP